MTDVPKPSGRRPRKSEAVPDTPRPVRRKRVDKEKEIETSISALARSRSGDCIDVLLKIAKDEKNSAAARVSAATALLDRGWGKPAQMVVGDTVAPENFGDITLEQVIAARAAIVDAC